jgi:hypothetical protein
MRKVIVFLFCSFILLFSSTVFAGSSKKGVDYSPVYDQALEVVRLHLSNAPLETRKKATKALSATWLDFENKYSGVRHPRDSYTLVSSVKRLTRGKALRSKKAAEYSLKKILSAFENLSPNHAAKLHTLFDKRSVATDKTNQQAAKKRGGKGLALFGGVEWTDNVLTVVKKLPSKKFIKNDPTKGTIENKNGYMRGQWNHSNSLFEMWFQNMEGNVVVNGRFYPNFNAGMEGSIGKPIPGASSIDTAFTFVFDRESLGPLNPHPSMAGFSIPKTFDTGDARASLEWSNIQLAGLDWQLEADFAPYPGALSENPNSGIGIDSDIVIPLYLSRMKLTSNPTQRGVENRQAFFAIVQDAKNTIIKKLKEKYPDFVKKYRAKKTLDLSDETGTQVKVVLGDQRGIRIIYSNDTLHNRWREISKKLAIERHKKKGTDSVDNL